MFNKMREQLKSLVTEGMSQDDLKKIASMSSTIDEAEEKFNKNVDELKSTKNDYIDLVKSSGFISKTNPNEIPEEPRARTLEEIAADIVKGGK